MEINRLLRAILDTDGDATCVFCGCEITDENGILYPGEFHCRTCENEWHN
jgi:hypothetical protein